MRGHLYRQSPNSFAFLVDLPRGADGRRRLKAFTIRKKTKAEAEVEAAKKVLELERGGAVDATATTIAEYLVRWLGSIRSTVSAKTWDRYEEIVRCHWIPSIGSEMLGKLQPLQIREAQEAALQHGRRDGRGGLSARTVHHHHGVLHEALDQVVREGVLTKNPADAVDPPRPVKPEMQVLDEDQLIRLFELVEETSLWMPVVLAGTTGMRRGEILALPWSEIRLTGAPSLSVTRTLEQVDDEVKVRPPKTKRSRRQIDLLPLTVDALRQHHVRQAEYRLMMGADYHDQGLVCPAPDGSLWKPDRLSDAFAATMKRLDLPRIRFHDLRHTHATLLLRADVHPKIVSERLGHASVAFTLDTYSHVLPGMQAEAILRLDQRLRRAGGR